MLDFSLAAWAGDPRGAALVAFGTNAPGLVARATELGMRASAVTTAQRTSIDARPRGSVDIAVAQNELQDVEDPISALREIGRCLRPSGIVVCTVPNFLGLASASLGAAWPWLARGTMHCCFTPGTLRQVFLQAGFSIEDCGTHAGDLHDDELLEILRRVKPDVSPENLAPMIERINHQGMGEEIVVVARRGRVFECRPTPAAGAPRERERAVATSGAGVD